MSDIFDDKPDPQGGDNAAKASASEMNSYLERIERLEDEKAVLNEDIKEIWAEAKARGYDTKVLKKLQSIRKMKEGERNLVKFYGETMGVFG